MLPFIWLIVLPVAAAPVVYLVAHVGPGTKVRASPLGRWSAFVALGLTWIPFGLAARDLALAGPQVFKLGALSLQLDGLSLLLAAVALVLGTAVSLFSGSYLRGESGEGKYHAMVVAITGIIIGLGCATDLFNLWVWFEAMAIASYLLVAFYRDQPNALEAGIKYLAQSATGSVLVLLGIALIFGRTGYLGLVDIRAVADSSPTLLAAAALLLIGFGVKAALVPMHTWLPDAHSQAPSGISALLSGVVIEAGLVALLRAGTALSGTLHWGTLLLAFGVLNMTAGNLLALRQTQIKRLLAFSSLSHMGYMLIGLGLTAYTGSALGAQGAFFHMLTHGLMKGLAFLAAGALLYALFIANGSHNPLTRADLNGAAKRYPGVVLGLSLALLGLGGLPPLAGFMSKWQIFVAGFASGQPLLYGVVIFAALNSVLSLAYYTPLVNAMYRLEPSEAVQHGQRVPAAMQVVILALSLLIVILGVWPTLIEWLTVPASLAVF